MKSTRLNFKAIGLLIIAALLYGLIFPLNSAAISRGASFFGYAFWQTFIAGLTLLAITRIKNQIFPTKSQNLLCFLIVGACGFGFPFAIFSATASHLPISLTSIVMALSPTFTYLLGTFLKIERLTKFGLTGIALGLIGVCIIVVPDNNFPDFNSIKWFAIALATPIFLATANMAAAILRPPDASANSVGAGFLLGGAVSIAPFMLATGQTFFPTQLDLIAITIASSLVNAIFIIIFAEIVRLYGPTFFSQFNYLAVVAASFWAFIFFQEPTKISVFIALIFMTLGVILSQRK